MRYLWQIQLMHTDRLRIEHAYEMMEFRRSKIMGGVFNHLALARAYVCWAEIVRRAGPLS